MAASKVHNFHPAPNGFSIFLAGFRPTECQSRAHIGNIRDSVFGVDQIRTFKANRGHEARADVGQGAHS